MKSAIKSLCFVTIAALSLAACQGGKSAVNTTNAEITAGNTLPIVTNGSVTLTIGAYDNYYTPASYTQNLPVWQAVEEKTGVKINWDVIPPAQYQQTMGVRLASGGNIPDLFTIPGTDPVRYGTSGVIEPLEELIDKYAPNTKHFLEENPNIHKLMKAPDGHIYRIASVVTGTSLAEPFSWLIRKDWLDNVGLQEPKTIDDWYRALKAFKENDANRNGKQDEQPLAFASHAMVNAFGNAWGLHLYVSEGFWPDENGKIRYEWTDPRAKELLIWLNKLYKEGLIDPDYLTTKSDQLISKVTKNLVGGTHAYLSKMNEFDQSLKSAGIANAEWVAVSPPQGPNGYKGHTEKTAPLSGYFGISASSKNKEVAIRWLDYVYASEEGNRLMCFGIEGKSYTMENGEPKFTDWALNNPDGLDLFSALRSLGAAPTLPWIRNDKGTLSKQPAQTIANNQKAQDAIKKVEPTLIDSFPRALILSTPEEASRIQPLLTDLDTKQQEWVAKFITGSQDINSKWDTFQKELKDVGIDEILKIVQQQYERYKN